MIFSPNTTNAAQEARLPLDNHAVAERLERLAELLEAQEANPYRVAAYRRAAATVRGLRESLATLIERDSR
jgi:DNA polymerase (family 10)